VAAPPEPTHGRKLVLGAVALTNAKFGIAQGRIRKKEYFEAVNEARNRIEQLIIADHFFQSKPFSWVGLIIRQGLKNDGLPEFQGIDEKHGDLELAIEIDTNELIDSSAVEIQRVFEIATLNALVSAGVKYDCSMERIQAELAALKA
jgi:hypothetical protein